VPAGGRAEVNGHEYIKMENLLAGYSKPCAMDIKMGTRSYDDNATPEKKAKMINMYPAREKTGFQVVGFKNYDVNSGQYEKWSGSFGKSLRPHTAITAWIHFLDNGERLLFEVDLMV
jgi:1D-myo-inositol-tetrakisphosphate 5-kinase/inositol-polyphosphate multikinase